MRLKAVAVLFGVVGLLVVISPLLVADPSQSATLAGLGVGMFAMGLGLWGISISRESDEKMAALSNLEFDEKTVVIQRYLDYFTGSIIGQLAGGPSHPKYIEFLGDLRALSHVAKWADQTRRQETRTRLDAIVRQLESKMGGNSLDDVKRLADLIWPNC